MHDIRYKLFCRQSLQTGTTLKANTKLQLLSTRRQEGRFSNAHCLRQRGSQLFVSRSAFTLKMECNFSAESRFRYYHYYFYIGGVPLFKPSVSNSYHIFTLFCYVCSYSTLFAMFMNIYHHIEDFDAVMYIAMLLILFSAENCTQLYLR
jgi:hypothetical protein